MIISAPAFSQLEDDNRILDQYIVMLKPAQHIDELIKEFPTLQVKKSLSRQMNIWLLQSNTTTGAEKLLVSLQVAKTVKLAQFNHRVQRRALVPDDPYFSSQWNMMNTGQGGGYPGADIEAIDAWGINHSNVTAAGDSVVIAIIDGFNAGGFDIMHEDLNFFVNTHEIPNNGIDDDSDGFVDDYYGWNGFDTTGNIQPAGNTDPHAMHVSGIAAAIGNNGKGVAGVCWGARILRVVGGSSEESQVVEAYDYVREMRRLYNSSGGSKGAFVVSSNSSFGVNGGPGGARHVDYPVWCAMYDSMGAVGILSAAATADVGWNIDVNDDMPTGCPSKFLMAVTNTNSRDQLAAAAAWGDTSIDLGAPGTGIYSTENANSYGTLSGTSMSSPHVAGAVAAMYAAACPQLLADYKLYPDSVALVIRQMILSGTTRLSGLYNLTVTGGRLNLFNAIKNLDEYNCSACNYSVSLTETQPACSNTCTGSLQLSVSGTGTYSYSWSNGQTGSAVINDLCPGVYSVTVTDSSTGCWQIKYGYLYKPDSIVVSSIHVIPVVAGDSGNIIVTANAGNYPLQYSLDSVHYQQASTLILSSNGSYNVYIKNSIGCIVQRTVLVSGIEDLTQQTDWNIYPNPVSRELNISFNLSRNINADILITNILGQKIFFRAQAMPAGINTVTEDVSLLSSGTYFVRLYDGNTFSTHKFVIAR